MYLCIATLCDSPTRDWTHALGSESVVLTTRPPGKSQFLNNSLVHYTLIWRFISKKATLVPGSCWGVLFLRSRSTDSNNKRQDPIPPVKAVFSFLKILLVGFLASETREYCCPRLNAKELMLSNHGVGEESWKFLRKKKKKVPWTAGRSNQSILKEINPEYSLEGLMLKLKLQYFGHLMWRADSLEKTLMLGKIESRSRRGRQRLRW